MFNKTKTLKQFIAESLALLLEGRIDTLKQKYKDKLSTQHDVTAEHHDSDAIVDHFAQHADPTHNKANTDWILGQYSKGNINQHDAPRVRSALETFERKKSLMPVEHRAITAHKTIGGLENALEPYRDQEVVSKKQQVRDIKSEGADKIHDSPNASVHHLKTEEASCAYGAGTDWCTAYTKAPNRFNDYNEVGNLYVIKHKPTGKRWQAHIKNNGELGEVKDEKDVETPIEEVVKHVPELRGIPQFKNKSLHLMDYHGMLHAIKNIETQSPRIQREILTANFD